MTALYLLNHDAAGRVGHIVRRVLLRVGGRDNGHKMVLVHGIVARIPHGKTVRWHLFNAGHLFEYDGTAVGAVRQVGPYPLGKHFEKAVDERGGRCIWVELANTCH